MIARLETKFVSPRTRSKFSSGNSSALLVALSSGGSVAALLSFSTTDPEAVCIMFGKRFDFLLNHGNHTKVSDMRTVTKALVNNPPKT